MMMRWFMHGYSAVFPLCRVCRRPGLPGRHNRHHRPRGQTSWVIRCGCQRRGPPFRHTRPVSSSAGDDKYDSRGCPRTRAFSAPPYRVQASLSLVGRLGKYTVASPAVGNGGQDNFCPDHFRARYSGGRFGISCCLQIFAGATLEKAYVCASVRVGVVQTCSYTS